MVTKLEVINYDGLELAITVVEEDLKEYSQEEKELILAQVLGRLQMKKVELKQSDMMSNAMKGVNLKSLMKRLTSGGEDDDEENLSGV